MVTDGSRTAELIGEYYSEELNTTCQVRVKEGGLVVQSLLNEDVKLSMIEPGCTVSRKHWFREVQFTRNASHQVDGLVVQTDNGKKTNHLRFKKQRGD